MAAHETISTWAIIKNASYFSAFFIGLSTESYGILAGLMVLDTILGVTRVAVVHGVREIRSYRLVSGMTAKLCIIMVPLVIAYTAKGIGMDLHVLASWALNLLILSHAYSVLGNIHSIYLRRDVYEFDAISLALTRLQAFIERALRQGAPDKALDARETNRDRQQP